MNPLSWRDRWRLYLFETDRRSLVLGSFAFFLNLGFGCGMASANALLVSRLGADSLFLVYLISAVLTFLLAAATYLWIDRGSRRRAFMLSCEVFAALIFVFWGVIRGVPGAFWPVFVIRVLSDVFFVLALLQYWLLAGEYFSNLEARQRFPLFVAANGVGYMIGGWLLQQFAPVFGAMDFLLLWAAVLMVIPILLKWLPLPDFSAPQNKLSRLENPGVVPKSAFRLLKVLFLFWLVFTFLLYGVDYYFNNVALQHIPDENRLAALFGRVAFFSLIAVLAFQLSLAGPLSRVLSVHRAMMFLCFALALGTALLSWRPSLSVAAFSQGFLIYFLESKAVSVLQPVANLFPDAMKGRAKILLDGFAPPSGDLLLMVVAILLAVSTGVFHLPYVLFAGAAAFLFFPAIFRRRYLNYLLDCAQSRDSSLAYNAIQALGAGDGDSAGSVLLQQLDSTEDLVLRRELVLSLGRMRYEPALPKLVEQFSISDELQQLAVVEALGYFRNYEALFALYQLMKSQDNASFQVRMSATRLMTQILGRRMIPLLQEALAEKHPRIQANAIESLALLRRPEIIPLVRPFLNSEHRRLRANAAIALYAFPSHRGEAREAVAKLFHSPDPMTRFAGIYAIGELRLKEFSGELRSLLLQSEDRQIRAVNAALAKMGIEEFVEAFARGLAEDEDAKALEALQMLARFPALSRWRVFESISKFQADAQARVLDRLDQTPFDFTQERALLKNRAELMFLPKR